MADNFKLPGSSYEEITKIIKAYASGKEGQPQTLNAIAQSTGMDRTVVSRNNAFLIQMELLSEGNQKTPTSDCYLLGRAYSLGIKDEISKIWKQLIENNEFLSRMISAVKIRNGMDRNGLTNHILYSAASTTTSAKVGANTIIEIFKVANIVTEDDGKIKIISDIENSEILNFDNNNADNSSMRVPISNPDKVVPNAGIIVNININIDTNVDELKDLSEKLKTLLESINV